MLINRCIGLRLYSFYMTKSLEHIVVCPLKQVLPTSTNTDTVDAIQRLQHNKKSVWKFSAILTSLGPTLYIYDCVIFTQTII